MTAVLGPPAEAAVGPRRTISVWWLSPAVIIGAVALPTTVLSGLVADDRYRALWRTPKVVDATLVGLFSLGLLLFILGALLPALRGAAPPARTWPGFTARDLRLLGRAQATLFALTMLGYVGFAFATARAGIGLDVFVRVLVDQELYGVGIRDSIGTIPGVTTMTQFGVAFVVVTGLLVSAEGWRRRHAVWVAVVLFLALVRAYFVTERLALLELVVPLVVVLVLGWSRTRAGARRAGLLPLVMLPVVVGVFAAFEYSRSWIFYQAQGGQSFPVFVVERFAGYYLTAYNNGAIRLLHQPDSGLPYDLWAAFWTAPGIADLDLYRRLTGLDELQVYGEALASFGNPEFNNTGGVASPFVDLGWVGGLLFFLLAGFLCGVLYRSVRAGRATGLLFYPLVVLTLLELPRYVYIAQGRATPALLAFLVIGVLLNRSRRNSAGAPA
ncbi:hypothetical protein [Klenkia taihuensis]|uniref:Oligosaccharide repeat unit polymerase n=1 Tax=Klenkia taihuensis TaxID=1225127 RepID=A0A1I1NQH9_9ACTN|nr:hypothetical protein [Klenkia taihuensis]GHE11791.1 hypothetical protein GCM10011381_26770 [Klenkia taihuensis]SFC99542.1 oligosaccharide repeat unit polymerase [Klenkia taihuensis]